MFIPRHLRVSSDLKSKIKEPSFNQEIYIKQHLRQQLTKFRRGWLSPSGWKYLLHDKDEYNLFPQAAICDIKNNVNTFLRLLKLPLIVMMNLVGLHVVKRQLSMSTTLKK